MQQYRLKQHEIFDSAKGCLAVMFLILNNSNNLLKKIVVNVFIAATFWALKS